MTRDIIHEAPVPDVDAMVTACETGETVVGLWRSEAARQERRAEAAAANLARYGRHGDGCVLVEWVLRPLFALDHEVPPCSCGLQQALDAKGST